jgi:predicted metal-dependent hydrolase
MPRAATPLPARRIRFEYPDDTDPCWVRQAPDFSYPANSVSLLMPFAEPYFVRSVRAALPAIDDGTPEGAALAERTRAYVHQEMQHAGQHRHFNDVIRAHQPRVARVERWMDHTCDRLSRNRSMRFNVAFAAGAETMAYSLARWTDKHLGRLFRGADPVPATLFLWHLAEEVEHKTAAFDVFEAVDGSRLRYAWASLVALVLLGWFVLAGTLAMMRDDHRLLHPMAHLRLVVWAVSVAFEILPTMFVSALPGHHPSSFADPPYLTTWLGGYDPSTATMPLWEG